ncbi:MAG: hypothetical protein AB7T06_14185 [Kofleriaceae bacterium]
MRRWIVVLLLSGCGRFGFGERDPSDGGDDDASDGGALAPRFCDDRVVTTLPIGALDAVAIRAVALDMRYAVAIETTAQEIPLLELDSDGAFVATHAPFTPGYAPLYGMSRLDNRPVVHLLTSGSSYIKFVRPGWSMYTTGPDGDPSMIDPAFVEIDRTTGFAAKISGGDFHIGIVDIDADPSLITDADYTPANAIGGSVVPSPSGARVVVEKTGGVCETFVVTAANTVTAKHTFSPCYAPKAAASSDANVVIVHRVADVGPFAVYVVPANPTDTGTTIPLSGATYARTAARVDGAVWVGHGSGSYRALMRFPNSGQMTESREDIPSFYFDLTERDAFWYDGATVHVSTPCLR